MFGSLSVTGGWEILVLRTTELLRTGGRPTWGKDIVKLS